MRKKPPNKTGRFILACSKAGQPVICVAEAYVVETRIPCEKRRPASMVKQKDDLLIFHSLTTDFVTYLPHPNAPPL
jgi:hypothetical protein